MKAVVVGLGEFGMALAQALSRNGDVLALVGSDKDITRFLADHTPKEEE